MRFSVLLLLLFLLPSPVHAFADGHIAYCDGADSTAALQDCVNKHHAAAQKKLNSVYEELIASLEGEAVEKLRELQATWLAYRDAECDWEASRVETDGLIKIYELSCEARMTIDRAELLEAIYKNEEKEMQAELSGFPRWMNALTTDYPDVFWRFGERKRIDLNCNGDEEVVMIGAAVSRIKVLEAAEDAMEKDEKGRTPHALDVVVAITESTRTGRPKSQLFRLPITQTLDGPSLCSDNVSLVNIVPEAKAEKVSADETQGEEASAEEVPVCENKVAVQAKNCLPVFLSWSGKDYTLSVPAEEKPQENQ